MDRVGNWATRPQQDRNYGQGQVPVQEKVGFVPIVHWPISLIKNQWLTNFYEQKPITGGKRANLSIAQTHFRSTANNVEIVIPVPQDADSPKFKTTIGQKDIYPLKLIMFLNRPNCWWFLQVCWNIAQAIASMPQSRMQWFGPSSPSPEEKWAFLELPTPTNALFVRLSTRHIYYPYLTQTHTNLMCERAS